MKRTILLLWINLCITCYVVYSQHISPVDKWKEYIEELAEETEDTERLETLYTELSWLAEHPFDLNRATGDDLRKLPFLTDMQIESILSYRQRYGSMASLYELKNMETFDFQTIERLLPFVYIAENPVENLPFSVENLLKHGDNELQIRYDQCFQQRKGYQPQSDSSLQENPNRRYLGEPFYHYLRYSYAFDDRLQAGFVGEKDAGEPFWNKHHKGYDYYSAHLFLKGIKKLKSLAVGDYKASFGQGLVVSHDFTPGRGATPTAAGRHTYGFRRHYSTNETDFFRGAAATLAIGRMEYSLFYSCRRMDAAVVQDTFPSLKTDGLHRLVRDREKLRNVPLQTVGTHIRYVTPSLGIGITALHTSFGRKYMQPDPKPYNLFYFRGDRNLNLSVDYLWKNRQLKLYGETALSRNGALATLNALEVTPTSYIGFLLLHRYYDRRYQALFGNAFSQQSAVQNEQGVYMGFQFVPLPYWKFAAYADVFRFPWLKYGVDAPSTGKEYMVQTDYTHNRRFSIYARYRYRQKEKNKLLTDSKTVSILPYTQHRFRIQATYTPVDGWVCRTAVDEVFYREIDSDSNGFMLSQRIGWQPDALPFQIDGYAAWFQTDDYSSRISSHEKNMLYAFSMPSFYGKGVRLALSAGWKINRHLSITAKATATCYADRDVIGTGLEAIDGSHRTDIYTLLRWKF